MMFLVLLIVIVFIQCASSKLIALDKYNISDVTVSGISSGGYMAVQMHVAFSEIISGAGIFAAGPYYCAESNAETAQNKCMATKLGMPNTELLIASTWDYATLLWIDSPLHLRNDRVFIFSGSLDTVVDPQVGQQLQHYYASFLDISNIEAVYSVEAEHCQPTLNQGNSCGMLSSPYIGKCNYDGAGAALNFLFSDQLNDRTESIKENLFTFNQSPFNEFPNWSSIGSVGYIYVPTACQNRSTSCRLHVSFHGCAQNLELVSNVYVTESGYNEWAEANNIIVVYPYATSSKMPYNPNGCWDWWAYTNEAYGLKSGVQMQFAKKIIDTLTGSKVFKTLSNSSPEL